MRPPMCRLCDAQHGRCHSVAPGNDGAPITITTFGPRRRSPAPAQVSCGVEEPGCPRLSHKQQISGSNPLSATKLPLWRSWCARRFEEPEDAVRSGGEAPNRVHRPRVGHQASNLRMSVRIRLDAPNIVPIDRASERTRLLIGDRQGRYLGWEPTYRGDVASTQSPKLRKRVQFLPPVPIRSRARIERQPPAKRLNRGSTGAIVQVWSRRKETTRRPVKAS